MDILIHLTKMPLPNKDEGYLIMSGLSLKMDSGVNRLRKRLHGSGRVECLCL